MGRPYVATVVASSKASATSPFTQHLDALKAGLSPEISVDWLAKGVAADIHCDTGADSPQKFLELIADKPVDCIIQPDINRRRKLLIADMESTIIEQEMLDELASTIGLRDKVAAITARAMNGELDFAAALKERVSLLKGLPASILDDVAKRITLMSGAEALLATLRKNGAKAWLVSGGFMHFAKPVADRLGFDQVFANELIVQNGHITGEVAMPIVDKNTKKELLAKACAELGLKPNEAMSVGDGANDVPMLEACNKSGGLGFAFHAKPNVRAVIPYQINHSDLRTILYAQGYKSSDIISS